MKLNLKNCAFSLALIIGAFVGIQNVSAATLNIQDSGYYYDRYDQNMNNRRSWNYSYYTVDGQVAYCIEPGVNEGNPMMQGDWSNTGLSNDIKERILLIGYYGYSYPGHQTNKYRMAAQGMMWSTILGNGTTVNFSTERWSGGNILDITNEKNEIEILIANHYIRPSFNGGSYTFQVGETITLTDTNNVLSNYNVNVSGANYSVNGNNLIITPTSNGNITISLKKNMPYTSDYKIFYGNGIQNMFVPGTTDPVVSQVRVNAYYGDIEINKKDSETGSSQGQATLEEAVYGVYNSSNELITKITTDKNGYGKSDKLLTYGSYYLKEISASKGYYLDNTRYDFDSKGQATITKEVKENVIKNYISILKQYDYVDGTTQFLNAEANIIFDIYYPNGDKYSSITTDKNGYASLDLPYGVWKFHQVNSITGYEKIYDFYITVDENSNLEQYYNILNNAISAYLQVFKTDSETGETIKLANTTFKILNTDTNQYVSQYVGGKVYSEFKTDENGIFITYLKLSSGNYKLIEVSAPNGYLKDKDGLKFTIGNDTHYSYTTYGAFITVTYKNTPIKGQLEIKKTGENLVIKDGKYTYKDKKLSGVTFEIYAEEDIKSADGNHLYYEKGTKVDTITTDKNGYAISKKLSLGKYYLIEVKTQDEYVLDSNKHYFELKEVNDETPIVFESYSNLNYLKKGTLEFTKKDLVNGDVIPNTIVEIYNENNELIFTGKTRSEEHTS